MNQASMRQAFKDGYSAAEDYLADSSAGWPNAPDSILRQDENNAHGMAWAKGFNFALVMAGICRMSADTEMAVREYEPEYFSTNLPKFPEAHRAAILERQRARLAANPAQVGDIEAGVRLHDQGFAGQERGAESTPDKSLAIAVAVARLKKEAIAEADTHLNNAGLPTYSKFEAALARIAANPHAYTSEALAQFASDTINGI